MRESPHIPLWIRILLLATVNLAILGIVFAIFLRLQLKPQFESFLMAEAREKVAKLAAQVAEDLEFMGNSRVRVWLSLGDTVKQFNKDRRTKPHNRVFYTCN